ncbi:MAG: hypothetical protein KBD06_01890 [Candidatus Pacebacteria bacterium]|nr:hypothetical protein [Candidatus Paceibacterota bacterium]
MLAILFVTGTGFAMYSYRTLPDVVVMRTATGFVPSKITIRKGQAIVFTSQWGKDFWPAADFHPTHGVYPTFDPKRPLKADESWRFVFDRAGVWTFHDHLQESMVGTIIVLGRPGESAEECLSQTATSSPNSIAECWAIDIIETLQTKGLPAAFDMFALLYEHNPSFRGLSCHDAGHILGAAAYKQYENDHKAIDRPETSYCGYGFYHGFMETMLREQGQFAEVRAYCEALKTDGQLNNPSGACFHGVGHAAFDSLPGDIWGNDVQMVSAAGRVCEQALVGIPERAQCLDGVFNALAVAASARTYGLTFDTTDPMELCRMQNNDYRIGCYKELGIGFIRERSMDRRETMTFIRSFKDTEAEAEALLGYMGDEAARAVRTLDLSAFHSFCTTLPSATERLGCERGVLSGLRQAGEPGKEFEVMFDYCALHPVGTERTRCYSFAILQTKDISSDKAAFRKACLAIDDPAATSICE